MDKLKCYTLTANDGHKYVTCDDKSVKPKKKKIRLVLKKPKEAATDAVNAIKEVRNISGSVKLKKQFIERLKAEVEKSKNEKVLKATKDFEEKSKSKRVDEIIELYSRIGNYGVLQDKPVNTFVQDAIEKDYKKFNVSNPEIDGQRVEVIYVKTTGYLAVYAVIKFPVAGKGGSISYYTLSSPRNKLKMTRKPISKVKLTKGFEKVKDELMELYGGETEFPENEIPIVTNRK
tara:strand:+ start:86 stop:781 length:696 start_codon:yes stop_codon:yes gene_type:complete